MLICIVLYIFLKHTCLHWILKIIQSRQSSYFHTNGPFAPEEQIYQWLKLQLSKQRKVEMMHFISVEIYIVTLWIKKKNLNTKNKWHGYQLTNLRTRQEAKWYDHLLPDCNSWLEKQLPVSAIEFVESHYDVLYPCDPKA